MRPDYMTSGLRDCLNPDDLLMDPASFLICLDPLSFIIPPILQLLTHCCRAAITPLIFITLN